MEGLEELEGWEGSRETADRGESVWKEEASAVWKLQGLQPLPPKLGQAVHLPQPTHPPASWPAFIHRLKNAIVSAWVDHRTQET